VKGTARCPKREESVMSQLAAVAPGTASEPVRPRARLFGSGVLAGAAAASVTTVAAALAKAAGVDFMVNGKEIPLGAFAWWSLVATAAGVGLAAVVKSRPRFVRITIALLVVSLLPAVAAPDDGASKLALVATHLIAAAVVIPWLGRRLSVERPNR
jgi:hypothetical protein